MIEQFIRDVPDFPKEGIVFKDITPLLQDPDGLMESIDLMAAVAENVSDAALEAGIGRAVFTSSTGSTNPPEGEPHLKNEVLHWSDPDKQLREKKFAAVGKTRLDRTVLDRMAANGGTFRVAVINPSMIVGPAWIGSSTPPMPTPPDRCTFLPICAQLPTVAHVSTIVLLST